MGSSALAVREAAGPWAADADDAPATARAADAAAADVLAEADALDELGDEIARMAAHMHAYKRRYLERVAEFDRLRGWEPGGHRSCAEWLSFRTGFDPNTAREHVRVARALESLPRTSRAMDRGRLSFSQVRALTRVATAEHEADLLEMAEGVPTATLERMVRAWKKGSRQEEAAREREVHRLRRLAVFPDDDGGYVVKGRLTAEVGAVLMRALEAAGDALFREEDRPAAPASEHERRREAARRRADALGLLAERALAAGFGEEVPVSGSRAERYQVFLHVDRETLAADGEPDRSELEDGTRVSAESVRRLACDVGVVGVLRGPEGEVLDVGRRRRTVPPALRRALEVRDRGCRFPGCGLRFTDAHHITHWADGGPTSLENCVLLCRRHHRFVHEEGWSVEWWGQRAVFRDPRDRFHTDTGWEAPELPADPVRSLVRENRLHGAAPGALAAGARWKRERNVPDDVWFRALEAGLAAAAAPP